MENEICNIGDNKENKINETLNKNTLKINSNVEQKYKREWDEYFNYDFIVKSINNGIDINNYEKYSFDNEAKNQLMNGIDLKMSNQITFSFKFKDEKFLSDNEDEENIINIDNIKFTEENDDLNLNNNNNFNNDNYEEISKKFVTSIFESIKNENKNNFINYNNSRFDKEIYQKKNLKDNNNFDKEFNQKKSFENGINYEKKSLNNKNESLYLIQKKEINFFINRNKNKESFDKDFYILELKKKEKIINELNDKIKKIQNSNNILSDENKKLIELVNIFKMMSDIDKKKDENDNKENEYSI